MRTKQMLQWISGTMLAAAMLTGCATSNTSLNLAPVGPDTAGNSLVTSGQLIVRTATEPHNDGNIVYSPHTGYAIYDATGKKVQFVQNRVGATDGTPMLVTLPRGEYTIEAQSEGYGRVRVPIVIEGGRLTRVYLERNGMPKADIPKQRELVTFPNGTVIGVRAHQGAKKP